MLIDPIYTMIRRYYRPFKTVRLIYLRDKQTVWEDRYVVTCGQGFLRIW